jgi:uncharacterized protein YjbI with pentapeptide repeats
LNGADLGGALLYEADLTYCDLRKTKNLDLKTVRGAENFDKAFYDDPTALGLRSDNNSRLDPFWSELSGELGWEHKPTSPKK